MTPPLLRFASGSLAIIGIAAFIISVFAGRPLQFNVANYTVTRVDVPVSWSSAAFFVGMVAALIVLCWKAASGMNDRSPLRRAAVLLHPLLLCVPFSVFAVLRQSPPFGVTWFLVLAFGLVALRAGARSSLAPLAPSRRNSLAAMAAIFVAIVVLTIVHVRIQINFFEHFMLGHPDIGHFTEELKNALAGRGLRSDSFPNTRLGWHFTPLLYVLAPGYALWPSPVYLMVCGPVLLHLPAIPFFYLARRLSGSVMVALLVAFAWLLLPSCSRMVYSNTYGFPWIVASMVLIATMLAAAIAGRWGWSMILLILVWLCEETTTAVTLGWGIALVFFLRQRVRGTIIAAGSILYFLLCTRVFIPYFSASGQYDRFSLFGELGDSIIAVVQSMFTEARWAAARLFRPQVWSFLATLLAPMAFFPLLGWRIAAAAAPTLFLIALLQNPEWLSIKFWHQVTVLPVLFIAGIVGSLKDDSTDSGPSFPVRLLFGERSMSPAGMRNGFACGLLACAALGHYLYGFSPLSKSFDVYAADPVLSVPDPRLAVVQKLRAEIPRDRAILATERLAAHFTDYRRVYTGKRVMPADFVILDRADSWDQSGLPQHWTEFAQSADYEPLGEFGDIVVYRRRSNAAPSNDD